MEVKYVSGPAGSTPGDGPREEGGGDDSYGIEFQGQEVKNEPLRHFPE